jgi:hypothetical protein
MMMMVSAHTLVRCNALDIWHTIYDTHPGGPIVPVELTGHPTDETGGDADLVEGLDCDVGGSRDVRIEKHRIVE